MNREVEKYEGELRNLRKFRDGILAEVELPADVIGAIVAMDVTDMTKECLTQALKSIHTLKKVTEVRLAL